MCGPCARVRWARCSPITLFCVVRTPEQGPSLHPERFDAAPGAKVFASPGAVCCRPGAVPAPTCPGAVLDFPFVWAFAGKLNSETKRTKAAMRIMVCSMHVGPATAASIPPEDDDLAGD